MNQSRWGSVITWRRPITLPENAEVAQLIRTPATETLVINFHKWRLFEQEELYASIDGCTTRAGINLNSNDQPRILNHIQDISFPFLKQLSVPSNLIESIDALARVFMPSLQELDVSCNRITSIKPLSRCHWPGLKEVSLASNLTPEHAWLALLHAPGLLQLSLEFPYESVVSEDAAWASKLQSQIEGLNLLSGRRIRRPQLKRVLGEKHPRLIYIGN